MDDKDTGLVHLGYREYDPAIGRFITPDPLGVAGGDVDVYGYCLDDPINFHDRTGLAGKSEGKNHEEGSLNIGSEIDDKHHETANKPVKSEENSRNYEESKKASAKENPKLKQDNKSKFTLKNLRQSTIKGIMAGIPIGATTGIPLGPLGVVAGGITEAITGPSVEMLYEIGSKAIADTFGIDENTPKRLREAIETISSIKERHKNKRCYT